MKWITISRFIQQGLSSLFMRPSTLSGHLADSHVEGIACLTNTEDRACIGSTTRSSPVLWSSAGVPGLHAPSASGEVRACSVVASESEGA